MIAEKLDVPVGWVQAGRYGSAGCDEAVSPQEVVEGTRLDVRGIGSTCLAIGLQTPPDQGPSKDVLVVCAAEPI